METITHNNGNTNINGNNSRPHPTKSRSNNFSHAAVNKSDVGDFQAGYFVMADMPYQPQPKPKNHNNNRTIERHSSEKRNHRPPQQPPHRARSTNDLDSHPRESDSNVSQGRLTTSPHRSPTRNNKRNSHSPPTPSHHSQSTHLDSNTLPMSPHKPRKAHENVSQTHVESGSPPKGPSPTSNRWAGPAFSNAPPPSSLPLPDFPPFAPSVSSSPLTSSLPQSASTTSSTLPFLAPPPVTYQEPLFFNQPPVPLYPYPHFNAHFSFAEATPAHGSSLAQLSTDLRRMLNITSEPVHAYLL